MHEFIELSLALYDNGNEVIFRGQRQDWPLLPKCARYDTYILIYEQEAFGNFKRRAIPHLGFHPSSDWQWLAIAQHSGLPTRLLDWSSNPLVALWFAVYGPAKDDQPGVVWAHLYNESDVLGARLYDKLGEIIPSLKENEVSPFEIERTLVYFPGHVSPNIPAQSGVFTAHPIPISPFEKSIGADKLTRISISAAEFPKIRRHLSQLGIDSASMRPGLSGLADHLTEWYHIESSGRIPK